MENIFKPKRSNVAFSVPSTNNLVDGEMAVNYADKKIYLRYGNDISIISNYSENYWDKNQTGISTISNVGIGTTDPTEKLHVDGNLRVTGGIYDSNNNIGIANSILISTGTGIAWTSANLNGSGSQGIQGTQGLQGLQGVQGVQGVQGFEGSPGSPGIQGSSGIQGFEGSQGFQGLQGISGSSGATIPGFSTSTSYTLQKSDAGGHVAISTSVIIPADVFSSGDAIVLINESTSQQVINSGVGITVYLAGTAFTGTRYLEQNGLANILCFKTNVFIIVGAGLT